MTYREHAELSLSRYEFTTGTTLVGAAKERYLRGTIDSLKRGERIKRAMKSSKKTTKKGA